MSKQHPRRTFSETLSDVFRRYPVLTSLFIVGLLAGVIYLLTQRRSQPAEPEVPQDIEVDDSLALNIMCTPTLECLPFYHALESGICDSLKLSLGITTETSQFDIDSLIRRTKTVDGAVIDMYRIEYYRKHRNPLPVIETIRLYGVWRLIASKRLNHVNELAKLKKRTVATSRFATSSLLLEQSIHDVKDLKFSDIYHAQINDFEIRNNMLEEDQIDAAVVPEPYAAISAVRGHNILWSNPEVATLVLCFRTPVYRSQAKQKQIEQLRQAYNAAVLDLNLHGVHAADSALIKTFHLPKAVIDTLKLPKYRPV